MPRKSTRNLAVSEERARYVATSRVTSGNRRRLDEITSELVATRAEIEGFVNVRWVRWGLLLAEIQEGKLYKSGGHTTFASYVITQVGISRSRAYQLIRGVRDLEQKRFDSRTNGDTYASESTRVDKTPSEKVVCAQREAKAQAHTFGVPGFAPPIPRRAKYLAVTENIEALCAFLDSLDDRDHWMEMREDLTELYALLKAGA